MKPITRRSSKTIGANENHFDYAVRVTRFVLLMIGVWPIPKFATNAKKIVTRLQNMVCYFLFGFIIIPGFLLIILKERDFKKRVKIIGPLLNCSLACIKYSLFIYNAKEIQSCIEQVQQDWQNTVNLNDREAMLINAKIGRKFAIFAAAFMYIGGLSYRTIVPLSRGRMLTPMNTTVRALANPSYFVKFDEQDSPAYEIVFTVQFFAGFLTYSVTCGTAGIVALFIMHVCGQLSILVGKLQHFNNITKHEDRTVANLLANIVEHQIKAKNFLKQVEEAMQFIWLIEIVGSSIILCLAGYHIINEWESSDSAALLTMFIIFTSFIITLFTNCYVGQLLTNQSVEVGMITSTMNWYRLSYKWARSLILVIAISNIPTKISAGRMIEMSLPTFNNIITTAMTYLNMLRTFM